MVTTQSTACPHRRRQERHDPARHHRPADRVQSDHHRDGDLLQAFTVPRPVRYRRCSSRTPCATAAPSSCSTSDGRRAGRAGALAEQHHPSRRRRRSSARRTARCASSGRPSASTGCRLPPADHAGRHPWRAMSRIKIGRTARKRADGKARGSGGGDCAALSLIHDEANRHGKQAARAQRGQHQATGRWSMAGAHPRSDTRMVSRSERPCTGRRGPNVRRS